MPETDIELEKEEQPGALGVTELNTSLAEAKARFGKLASPEPQDSIVSEQAREILQLKAQLQDAERATLRVQKAAADYREQLNQTQADIATMKNRWFAAEKARNAVSSKREVDSNSVQTQLLRAQKELERTQQMARSDMERAASRMRVLEERLQQALAVAATAEGAQDQYRKRSHVLLSSGIALAVILCGFLIYKLVNHTATGTFAAETGAHTAETPAFTAGTQRSAVSSARPAARVDVESISKKAFVPHGTTKSLPDALGHLDRALQGFPGLDQEAILKQVKRNQSIPGRPVCSFDWSNGAPAMVFGKGTGGINAENWAIEISRCADAIEQAH